MDRIRKKEKKITGKTEKSEATNSRFAGEFWSRRFALSRESGQQHFSDNSLSVFFLLFFFLYPLLSYSSSSSSSSSSFPSLSVFSLFLPLSLILFQHSFSTIFHLHLTALIFSLNQSVRKYGNRQSIYLHIPRNKQTNRPYNSFYYSRISLLFGHYRQDSFLLKPAMTEVSNTRLYLGNLPRNGMLAHPSTTTTNTITTVIASS